MLLLLLALLGLFSPPLCAAAADGSWGLSFPQPGQKPHGNASASSLLAYDAWFVGSGEEKVIYLTFDAGYENGNTAPILDALKKEQVPAAFFLVGAYIRDNPELTRRIAEEGHLVCNHTMNHPDMSAISGKEAFAGELARAEELYRSVTGREMSKYYRPPSGKYSTANLQMAKELGYKTVFWSLAYVDWLQDKQPAKEEAFAKLMPRLHPGTVLLLHTTSQTNALILEELIARCQALGYRFESLPFLTGGTAG
ncbi:MAG: polysaccharide deacetylase family protein [Clostridiales bacterium]|nr:polysaccharide deacetylase family protein [Clostridiales bacterium]